MDGQVLSIVQMQELIDMGIDVSKASMYISEYGEIISNVKICELEINWTPTFTLQDILEMLPDIFVNECACVPVIYKNCCVYELDHEPIIHMEYAETTLNAAFNMLKWCKQNNYI